MDIRIRSLFLRLAVALVVLFCLHYLTVALCLSSRAGLIVDAVFSQPERFTLYWRMGGDFSEQQVKTSRPIAANNRQATGIVLNDQMMRQFRLDFGEKLGAIRLYRLQLTSHFGKPIIWGPAEIARQFVPSADIVSMLDKGDHLEIETKGGDPHLLSPMLPPYRNIGIAWLLPLVFAALMFLYSPEMAAACKRLPVFADLRDRGNPGNIEALDGVRGLAVLAVLAEHTGILSGGIGRFGVYLFFALSGFLLARPFIKQPQRAVDAAWMRRYILRRLKRILPMYYFFITVAMLLDSKADVVRDNLGAAIRHYLFLQGDGHLWTLPQEMFFYAILPLVVLGFLPSRVCRNRAPPYFCWRW